MLNDAKLITFVIFLPVVLLCAGITGGIHIYEYLVDRPACEKYSNLSGVPTYWSFGTSCIVKRGDKWISFTADVENKSEINLTTQEKK